MNLPVLEFFCHASAYVPTSKNNVKGILIGSTLSGLIFFGILDLKLSAASQLSVYALEEFLKPLIEIHAIELKYRGK